MHVKDCYGILDLECLDFEISSNNKFILVCGKDGVNKVFDYFMRGETQPTYQAFTGHLTFPHRAILTKDMRHAFSIGQWNGIYKWNFYGDRQGHDKVSDHFEPIEGLDSEMAPQTQSLSE